MGKGGRQRHRYAAYLAGAATIDDIGQWLPTRAVTALRGLCAKRCYERSRYLRHLQHALFEGKEHDELRSISLQAIADLVKDIESGWPV